MERTAQALTTEIIISFNYEHNYLPRTRITTFKGRLSYLPPVLKIRSALGAPFGCWYRGRRSRLVFAGAGRCARDCNISGVSGRRKGNRRKFNTFSMDHFYIGIYTCSSHRHLHLHFAAELTLKLFHIN